MRVHAHHTQFGNKIYQEVLTAIELTIQNKKTSFNTKRKAGFSIT